MSTISGPVPDAKSITLVLDAIREVLGCLAFQRDGGTVVKFSLSDGSHFVPIGETADSTMYWPVATVALARGVPRQSTAAMIARLPGTQPEYLLTLLDDLEHAKQILPSDAESLTEACARFAKYELVLKHVLDDLGNVATLENPTNTAKSEGRNNRGEYVATWHYFLQDGDVFYLSNDLSEGEAALLCETLNRSSWGYRDAASTPPLPTPKQLSFLVPYSKRPPKVPALIYSVSAASDPAQFLVLDHPNNHDWEFRIRDGIDDAARDYHDSILALRATRAMVPHEATPKAGSTPVARLDGQSLDAEARALGLLSQHPEWTVAKIAEMVGVKRQTPYKWPRFMSARTAFKEAGKSRIPRGSKSGKTGDMEAWNNDI